MDTPEHLLKVLQWQAERLVEIEEKLMHTLLDRVQLAWAEAQRLTRYLHALPPAAWHHPSACECWQVGDAVVHLVACAEVYAGLE